MACFRSQVWILLGTWLYWKSRQKTTDFKWSGFGMVGTTAVAQAIADPFENRTIWNLIFKKSGFQMFLGFERMDIRSPLCTDFCTETSHNLSICLQNLPFPNVHVQEWGNVNWRVSISDDFVSQGCPLVPPVVDMLLVDLFWGSLAQVVLV